MEKNLKIIGLIAIIVIGSISVVGFFIFYGEVFQEEGIEPSDNDERSWRLFTVGNHNFSSLTDGVVNKTYWKLEIGWRTMLSHLMMPNLRTH